MRPGAPNAFSADSAVDGSAVPPATTMLHVVRLRSSVLRLTSAESSIAQTAGMMPALAMAKPIVSMPEPRQLLSRFTMASLLVCMAPPGSSSIVASGATA